MSLKQLAKLRQYDGIQDVQDFLKNDFRQNMQAIEESLKGGLYVDYGLVVFGSLSVPNNTASTIPFGSTIDPYSIMKSDQLSIVETGSYLLRINIVNLLASGVKTITLECLVNGVQESSTTLIEQSATTDLTISPSVPVVLSLTKGDQVLFKLHNTSGSNTNVSTMSSGLLEIKKILN